MQTSISSVSCTLRLLEARVLSLVGQGEAALARVGRVLAEAPAHPRALFQKARFEMAAGRNEAARQSLRELVSIAPNYPRALGTLARLSFPGPHYRDVLACIHRELAPQAYLEIGVEFGLTLRLAERAELAVGVDPNPRPRQRLRPNTRVFAETSDDFFTRHAREEVFGERRVDFAFIDGMHRFEYVLRDFCNVEGWCHEGSTVVLHDCLPVAAVSAERERRTQFWVGDTWKAFECLLAERPDLRMGVVPCYPSGLVVIRRVDPNATTLARNLPALVDKYREAPYPHGESDSWPERYGLIDNSFAALAEFLRAPAHPAPAH